MKKESNTVEQGIPKEVYPAEETIEVVSVYNRPPMQKVTVEILKSSERPSLSAVVSNELPPKGLSGMLRRYAFRFSESEYGHWLPLLLADRIEEVEGVIEDLGKGVIPNILQERGCRAEWKYNRKSAIQKATVLLVGVGAVASFLIWKNRNKKNVVNSR